jgi:hypothetical protein
MENNWKNREDFINAIGKFTIEFSKLEFSLLELCAFTVPDLPNYKTKYVDFIGLPFEGKRDLLKNFIKKEIPELSKEWEIINCEIGEINSARRHLVHGIGASYLFREIIVTYVKNNKTIESREYKVSDINKLTNRIGHLITGDNGLSGHFDSKFKTAATNAYNNKPTTTRKVIFEDTGVILSDYKGK